MAFAYTCTVTDCGHRQAHEFSRRSYEQGIVLVTCDDCKNRFVESFPFLRNWALNLHYPRRIYRHLIADHLGWFKNLTEERKRVAIEQLKKLQGQKVARGKKDAVASSVLEYSGEDDTVTVQQPKPQQESSRACMKWMGFCFWCME